jgi:hypothetical protein
MTRSDYIISWSSPAGRGDVVVSHDSAHHVRADGLVVGTVPLVANTRDAFRSHDRRDPAKKSGTTMRGESTLHRLHGIIGIIGSA